MILKLKLLLQHRLIFVLLLRSFNFGSNSLLSLGLINAEQLIYISKSLIQRNDTLINLTIL